MKVFKSSKTCLTFIFFRISISDMIYVFQFYPHILEIFYVGILLLLSIESAYTNTKPTNLHSTIRGTNVYCVYY